MLSRVTPRTRLAVLDHVTSRTALVFPIAELVRELEARGVDVLIDGAHAPGMVELDIAALAPAYYAANCHKWLGTPEGVGFLWVREDRRGHVRPAVISQRRDGKQADTEEFAPTPATVSLASLPWWTGGAVDSAHGVTPGP